MGKADILQRPFLPPGGDTQRALQLQKPVLQQRMAAFISFIYVAYRRRVGYPAGHNWFAAPLYRVSIANSFALLPWIRPSWSSPFLFYSSIYCSSR